MTAMSNEGAKDKQVTLTTFLAKCKKRMLSQLKLQSVRVLIVKQ